MRLLALVFVLAVAAVARADDHDAKSFVTVRVEKTSTDESGNEMDQIIVSNSHDSRTIRATIHWLTVARERETDVTLKPGQEKILAHDQANAREVQVVFARFKSS